MNVKQAPDATATPAKGNGNVTSRGFSLGLMPVDLRSWDTASRGDLLAVFTWTDVRPLRGAAGLLDWRLSGKLSSLIQSGRLTGAEGEQLLLPLAGRLPWKVTMVMGLGPRVGFTGVRFKAAVQRLLAALRGLGMTDVAIAPPGRDIEALPVRRAAELLLGELRDSPDHAWLRRLTIVESPAGYKELADLIPAPAARKQTR